MNENAAILAGVQLHTGTITLNRPDRRNALTPEMLLKIHETLDAWALSGEVRCVVITGGSGTSFSSGFDISAFPSSSTSQDSGSSVSGNPVELALNSVAAFPYPTIAMINGHAFGAGLNLAICCDMRIAVADARMGMPPARLGLVYPPEGIRQFIEVVGMARAREIFFSGRTYQGADLLHMGLVNRVVQKDDLAGEVYGLAGEIAENAPLSLRGIKRIMAMFRERMSLASEQEAEAEGLIRESLSSDDLKEGLAAFLDRRKPRFTGK